MKAVFYTINPYITQTVPQDIPTEAHPSPPHITPNVSHESRFLHNQPLHYTNCPT